MPHLIHFFCELSAWEPFKDLIPENERSCFISAYSKRLNSTDLDTQVRTFGNLDFFGSFSLLLLNIAFVTDVVIHFTHALCTQHLEVAAARAWTKWEMMTAHLLPNEDNIKKGDDDKFALVSSFMLNSLRHSTHVRQITRGSA
ncbi:hypothetical protein GIB67_020109 [Kingdonia uniflora]|uniref:Uncharacterized protein n=1 Tax=Kingdonia uniflora TaxID=39325 RepID=A0A7J7L2J3_9MAGN|nr:hypothetical protein GIB67_020109 [Kingdonia uniflora]